MSHAVRRAHALAGGHLAVLVIALAAWWATLMLNSALRVTVQVPFVPVQLVLFGLAFWMTVRTRDAVLAVACAAAWLAFGVCSFVVNYDSLASAHLSHEIARFMLASGVEAALVMLAGGALGIAWLRRGPPGTLAAGER